ncbi:MAG: hypothetical protein EOP11_07530 [Proteobacteria bacterium]|nr:MAG: hypothetical protein EOP11_07530 [Pseudomonadota bacterium]
MLKIIAALFVCALPAAQAANQFLCTTGDLHGLYSDRSLNISSAKSEVINRCLDENKTEAACGQLHCAVERRERALEPALESLVFSSFVNQQCDSNADCPGFANSCFGGKCTQPGFQCDSNADCPGFGNSCFGGKCTRQEPLCDSDADCPGFANSCFGGKCTNP